MQKESLVIFIIILLVTANIALSPSIVNARDVDNPHINLKINRRSPLLDKLAIKSLDRIIQPLNNQPLELTDEELNSLDYLSECKIVGLGEATHGTKEFFQLKHRIFKYLVENYGFKIFAFECDMGESYYVNNFVINGEGDIDHIMTDVMQFWTWRTKEVKELLLWMRDYNENKSEEDKIHFIGIDCQCLTYQPEIIINYFNNSNVSLKDDCSQFLTEIDQIPWNLYEHYLNVSLAKKDEINKNVDLLVSEFENLKDELISASSEFEYKFIKQIALNIKQVNENLYGLTHGDFRNFRDAFMATNTIWTSDLFGEKTKVALWAHNGHIQNSGLMGSIGFHLKIELKEEYQIIGFAFSQGNFTAVKIDNGEYQGLVTCQIEEEPLYGSFNYLCHQAKYKNFILKKSDIPKFSFLNLWILKPRHFLSIGAVFGDDIPYYIQTYLKINYDVIINWDSTTASEQLSYQ